MSCTSELESFFKRYISAYQDQLSELPRYYSQGENSPCVTSGDALQSDKPVYWRAVKREISADFSNVEQALDIQLHPDINAFFGHFWTAPCLFYSDFGEGELTGVWNNEDFDVLQQNIIGHLMMKQKLKQPLTWFIGLLDEGDKMLTVNNEDASVWIEIPGELQREKLADNLAIFLTQIYPRVAPPVKHEELLMPALAHVGILARLKIMWGNLTGRF